MLLLDYVNLVSEIIPLGLVSPPVSNGCKLPIVTERGLSAIGDFPYNFSQGAVACFWFFRQTKVSVAVSSSLSLFRFCIYALWCLGLGLCLIFSVSVFITSPNFNLLFDWYMILIFNSFLANFSLALCWWPALYFMTHF